MLSAALNIGASGLFAFQRQADNAAANLANQNTPGYRRLDTDFATLVNGGVHGSTIHRFNPVVATRISSLAGEVSASDAQATEMMGAQSVMSDASKQVSSALNELRAALGTAAYQPNDPTSRKQVEAKGQALASVVNTNITALNNQLADLTSSQAMLQGQAQAKMAELATLNKAAAQTGATPDIKDKQAQTGRELAELIGGQVSFDGTGQANFSMADGTPVVVGQAVSEMPEQLGGRIGGLAAAQTQVTALRDQLFTAADGYAKNINALSASGVDATGKPGAPLFDTSNGGFAFVGTANTLGLSAAAGASASVAQKMADVGSLSTDVSGLATQAASQASMARTSSEATSSSLNAVEGEQQKQEGVNVDAEFITLTTAQKAYEANAKLIKVADEMLGTLLSIKA